MDTTQQEIKTRGLSVLSASCPWNGAATMMFPRGQTSFYNNKLQVMLRYTNDNRKSVAHVDRSVELAATCLNISAYEAIHKDDNNDNKILTDQDVAS